MVMVVGVITATKMVTMREGSYNYRYGDGGDDWTSGCIEVIHVYHLKSIGQLYFKYILSKHS